MISHPCRIPQKNRLCAIARPDHPANPYLALRRRKFSEPLLLLLVFVFGVWLWKNHILPGDQYAPGSCELALIKIDRDLRLADGAGELPAWLPPVVEIESRPHAIAGARRDLEALAARGALTPEGGRALAILIELDEGRNPARAPFARYGLEPPPAANQLLARIIHGEEHWWEYEFLKGLQLPETSAAAKLVEARNRTLTGNTLKARGIVVAIALAGLVFLPGTLLGFGRAGKRPTVNHAERWKLSFGLGVFLLAYLAFIGFGNGIQWGLDAFAGSHEIDEPFPMGWFISLDALSRLLPAAIALALLFRRPRHAFTRLGITGPLDGRMVLGGFSLILILQYGISVGLGSRMPPNPTGGLSMVEAGPAGLVFAVVSACIVAPFAEEILYRGVLFRSLANRLGVIVAVLVSAAVFALTHFANWEDLSALAVFGAVAALAFASSRTLLTAIALHALYNAAIKIPEWIVYHAPLS